VILERKHLAIRITTHPRLQDHSDVATNLSSVE